MLIDWFTVGAQAFNFLILVWLMQRYLYKPIRAAIDAREKRIASELADAAAKQAEAQRQCDEFQRKNVAINEQRSALIRQATESAEAQSRNLLEQAATDADALGAKLRESARREVQTLYQAIGRAAQQEVFGITRKVLAELATTTLEEHACGEFMRRMRSLDGPEKATMSSALRSALEPAVVRSAFGLPAIQREAIRKAVHETFAVDPEIRFETAPDLIGGIELTANGQKIAWSIAGYLASLEERVANLVQAQDKPKENGGGVSVPESNQIPAAKPLVQPS